MSFSDRQNSFLLDWTNGHVKPLFVERLVRRGSALNQKENKNDDD